MDKPYRKPINTTIGLYLRHRFEKPEAKQTVVKWFLVHKVSSWYLLTMDETMEKLRNLHHRVDDRVAAITASLPGELVCRLGCSDCCVDDITVFAVEATRIRKEFGAVLEQKPAPRGRCAFLNDAGGCRIYAARPYVCRTQGVPLRWFDETDDGEMAEYRDICPKNDDAVDLLTLVPEQCHTIGPYEDELRTLQETAYGDLRRVTLRSLFS